MWSVVMLSSIFKSTLPVTVSGRRLAQGERMNVGPANHFHTLPRALAPPAGSPDCRYAHEMLRHAESQGQRPASGDPSAYARQRRSSRRFAAHQINAAPRRFRSGHRSCGCSSAGTPHPSRGLCPMPMHGPQRSFQDPRARRHHVRQSAVCAPASSTPAWLPGPITRLTSG